jgi:uncharacterized protein YkwD
LVWLNTTRRGYGLRAVGWDNGLCADAANNNYHQAVRGLGHFFMGRARRQNSAFCAGYAAAANMWLASPAHCAALLDPTITRIAVHRHGAWFTFSAW